MLVRGFVGFKPDKASSRSRRRTVEPSDKMERAAFVKQWGGEIRHTDSLPLAVQGALAEAFKRDGLGELHGKRR